MATNTTQSKYLNLYFDRREGKKARRRIFWWHTTHTFMTLFKSMSDIFMSLFCLLSREHLLRPLLWIVCGITVVATFWIILLLSLFFYFVAPCHRIPLILVICDTSECVCVCRLRRFEPIVHHKSDHMQNANFSPFYSEINSFVNLTGRHVLDGGKKKKGERECKFFLSE